MKDANFLTSLNMDLESLQSRLASEHDGSEDYCNIFILGLPRSGTSLLSQMIFSSMEVACTNNLMARFWNVPLVGACLSRIVLGNRRETNFTSQFGTTNFPWEPHEFSWFWHDLLHISVTDTEIGVRERNSIDWLQVKKRLCLLNAVSGLPYVHKPLEMVGQYLNDFVRIFEKAIYIYIDRDPMDVACSLANVRRARNEDMTDWWGSYPAPEEYLRLKDEPYNIQIAGQITYLRDMYAQNLPIVPEKQLITTDYDSLCQRPAMILTEIQERSRQLGGEISLLTEPAPQEMRSKRDETNLRQVLLEGFNTIGDRANAR